MALRAGEIMFLVGMEAGAQFQEIGDRITGIGKKLQSLSMGGLRSFANVIKEAAEAGKGAGGDRRFIALSKSVEAASKAFRDLRLSIAEAISPAVTQGLNAMTKSLQQMSQWISENGQLVLGAAAFTVAIGAMGTALVGVGTVIAAFGAAISGIVATISILATPVGAVAAGLALVAAGMTAVIATGFALWLKGIIEDTEEFKGFGAALADSLKSGDLERAMGLIEAAFLLLWKKVSQSFAEQMARAMRASGRVIIAMGLENMAEALDAEISGLEKLLGMRVRRRGGGDGTEGPDRSPVRPIPLGAARRVGTGPQNMIVALREQERARIRGRGGAFVMSLPASEVVGGSNRAGYAGTFAGRGADVRGLLNQQLRELKEISRNTKDKQKFT